jgi:hypothetical protein
VFVPGAKSFLVVLAPSMARTEDKNANSIHYIPYQFEILFQQEYVVITNLLYRSNPWIPQAISFLKFTRYVPKESVIFP